MSILFIMLLVFSLSLLVFIHFTFLSLSMVCQSLLMFVCFCLLAFPEVSALGRWLIAESFCLIFFVNCGHYLYKVFFFVLSPLVLNSTLSDTQSQSCFHFLFICLCSFLYFSAFFTSLF